MKAVCEIFNKERSAFSIINALSLQSDVIIRNFDRAATKKRLCFAEAFKRKYVHQRKINTAPKKKTSLTVSLREEQSKKKKKRKKKEKQREHEFIYIVCK